MHERLARITAAVEAAAGRRSGAPRALADIVATLRKEAAQACPSYNREYYGGKADEPHVHVYGQDFHLKVPDRYDIGGRHTSTCIRVYSHAYDEDVRRRGRRQRVRRR